MLRNIPHRMRRFVRLILLASCAVLLAGCIGVWWLLQSPLVVSSRQVLFVPEGTTFLQVIEQLESRSAIHLPWFWQTLARVGSKIVPLSAKMGSYELAPTVTHAELFVNILRGRNRLVRRLTIYEGEPFPRLAGVLARTLEDDSARILQLITRDSLARHWNLGSDARSLEGFLLPATYEVFEREPVEHALRRIVRTFERVWAEHFARADLRGLTRYQMLTLASIVEGEVANPAEYRRIAGVYWNRLARGMKLEADPTVQYALGFPLRRLTYRDYRIEHPYNTYVSVGLPPGPINAASQQAIEAVLNPERHQFLYFCSTGDSTGTHRFAQTYAEHRENVRRYHELLRQRDQRAVARLLR
jgi:UPF0755 protein